MEGGQGLTEVRSVLTAVLKCTFEAIWHPDCHQNALCKLGSQAKQVQESLYQSLLTYYPYTKTGFLKLNLMMPIRFAP